MRKALLLAIVATSGCGDAIQHGDTPAERREARLAAEYPETGSFQEKLDHLESMEGALVWEVERINGQQVSANFPFGVTGIGTQLQDGKRGLMVNNCWRGELSTEGRSLSLGMSDDQSTCNPAENLSQQASGQLKQAEDVFKSRPEVSLGDLGVLVVEGPNGSVTFKAVHLIY